MPAAAGIHLSDNRAPARWVPACARDDKGGMVRKNRHDRARPGHLRGAPSRRAMTRVDEIETAPARVAADCGAAAAVR